MQAPDITYRYAYPKDIAGQTFELLSRDFNSSTAAASITFVIGPLSKDKVLIITNIAAQALPGLTQDCNGMSVEGRTAAGVLFPIIQSRPRQVTDQNEVMNWQGAVYLPGGGEGQNMVEMVAAFNAGVAANVFNIGLHGIVIPRGNAAQF